MDLFISRLQQKITHSDTAETNVNIGQWCNYLNFDIMADLSFGESFNCLEESRHHPRVSILFSIFKSAVLFTSTRYLPGLERSMRLASPNSVAQKRRDHFEMSKAKVYHRLEQSKMTTRNNDIMAYVLRHKDYKGMSVPKIEATFPFVVLAGSETTPTALAGITDCLLNNPQAFQQCIDEIRKPFPHRSDMTFDNVSKLPYLGAVIDECLRVCAPVAWLASCCTPWWFHR